MALVEIGEKELMEMEQEVEAVADRLKSIRKMMAESGRDEFKAHAGTLLHSIREASKRAFTVQQCLEREIRG